MSTELTLGQLWFRRSIKVALVAVIALLIFLTWPKKVIEVRTVAVTRGPVEDIVGSLQAGEVRSLHRASLRASTIGRVEQVLVERGDRVEEGQVLVEMANQSLRARVRLAKANLTVGLSSQRSAKLRRDAARRALDRSSKLAAKGVLSKQALDRIQSEHGVTAELVISSEANMAQLRASVDLAMAALADTRVQAPFAGLVTRVHVGRGEYLLSGAPVADLVDDHKVRVIASVDEADAGRLQPGMKVRVECDAYPDKPFWGKLAWISPVLLRDLRQNRHLEIEVSLDGPAEQLKVGMSADVEVVVEERKEVLFVPSNVIMRRGDQEQVYVLAAGRIEKRQVRTGLSNWDRSEIISGLTEGERVVVSLESKGLEAGIHAREKGTLPSARTAY